MAGLSVDTLRWYEKEGLLPRVGRDGYNRRSYSPREQPMVLLLTALRDTGMPTADMKSFVTMLGEGAASHTRRIALLEEHHRRLDQRRAAIDAADQALQHKIAHYRGLIDDGLDCEGAPVSVNHSITAGLPVAAARQAPGPAAAGPSAHKPPQSTCPVSTSRPYAQHEQ